MELKGDQEKGKKKEEQVEAQEPSQPAGMMATQTKKGDNAYPSTVTPGVGGGEGQTRYDYDKTKWLGGRWREDIDKDIAGPKEGTFVTVVGLQVDGRWDDGVLMGAFLRQWGTRGGWAACGIQFLGDMRWSAAAHKSFGGRYWKEGGSELEMDQFAFVSSAGPLVETEEGTGKGLKPMGGTGVAVFGAWARNFKSFKEPDKYGRWAGGIITGKTVQGMGRRRLGLIAVYRAPARTLTAGCLVTRVAKSEGYKTAKEVQAAFYQGVGRQIEEARREGPTEFIVQGDFNATVVRGAQNKIRPEDKQLTAWCSKHGLVIVEFKSGAETPTFHASRGKEGEGVERQLDIILVSEGLAKLWGPELVEVKAVPGCASGHHGLVWKGGEGILSWLGLMESAAAHAKERQRHKRQQG